MKRISTMIAMALFIVNWTSFPAQSQQRYKENPYTLVYEGAITNTLKAAQGDKRLKAVATLSMFNSGEVRRNGFQHGQVATIQERLQKASDARNQEAAGGKIQYAGVASITDEEIARTTTDLYRHGYEYYYRSHAHPNSK